METFAQSREFIDNPHFGRDRESILANLALQDIDSPIRKLVAEISALPFCFSIQSCYGHFVDSTQPAPGNLEPVPAGDTGPVQYRIAYIALCLENSTPGRLFHEALEQVTVIDAENIQFGSPGWFWERYLNSYALQVEPRRFIDKDAVTVGHSEARHIQRIRDRFFAALAELVGEQKKWKMT